MHNPQKHALSLLARWAVITLLVTTPAFSQAVVPEKVDEKVVEMSPFSVSASADAGYGAALAGSSGRLNTAYIDIPQATTVITSELLAAAALYDSLDALKFVPSVQAVATHNPQYNIRGLGTYKLYADGFHAGSHIIIDPYFFDRIEVVKGPSSTSFGRGDPAGFVNYVSKRPIFARRTELGITVGTGNDERNNFRYTLDNNGLVTEDGKTAYRLVGAYAIGSGTRDLSEFERTGALLSVKRTLDRGSVTVVANASHNNNPGAVGNTSFNDPTYRDGSLRNANNTTTDVPVMPPNYVFGYYGEDGVQDDIFGLAAIAEYRIMDGLWTRQAVRYSNVEKLGSVSSGNIGSVRREADGRLTINLTLSQRVYEFRSGSYQADFLKEMKSDFLASRFNLLVGGDITDSTIVDGEQSVQPGRQPLLDFNRSNPNISYARRPDRIGVVTESVDKSPYAQLQSMFLDEKVQLVAAARKIYFDGDSTNRVTGLITKVKNSTPWFTTYSALFKPLKWLSVYGSLSEYTETPSVVAAYRFVQTTDPRYPLTIVTQPTTKLQEIGVKGALLDGKVTFSFAIYGLESSGVPRAFQISANDVSAEVYLSKDRINGWDLEIFGQPHPKLTFMAGAGFTNSETNVPAGTQIAKVPLGLADTVYANLSYSFVERGRDGFGVNLGAKGYLSGSNVGGRANISYPKDNVLVDGGVSYGFGSGRYRVGLKVNNMFSKQAVVTGGQYIMNGRMVYLSLNATY